MMFERLSSSATKVALASASSGAFARATAQASSGGSEDSSESATASKKVRVQRSFALFELRDRVENAGALLVGERRQTRRGTHAGLGHGWRNEVVCRLPEECAGEAGGVVRAQALHDRDEGRYVDIADAHPLGANVFEDLGGAQRLVLQQRRVLSGVVRIEDRSACDQGAVETLGVLVEQGDEFGIGVPSPGVGVDKADQVDLLTGETPQRQQLVPAQLPFDLRPEFDLLLIEQQAQIRNERLAEIVAPFVPLLGQFLGSPKRFAVSAVQRFIDQGDHLGLDCRGLGLEPIEELVVQGVGEFALVGRKADDRIDDAQFGSSQGRGGIEAAQRVADELLGHRGQCNEQHDEGDGQVTKERGAGHVRDSSRETVSTQDNHDGTGGAR